MTLTLSPERKSIKYGGRTLCYIPLATDALTPISNLLKQCDSNLRDNRTAENIKARKEANDRFNNVFIALIESDTAEISTYLWEKYHATKNKIDRKLIKTQYNELANSLNLKYKRKVYLLIH